MGDIGLCDNMVILSIILGYVRCLGAGRPAFSAVFRMEDHGCGGHRGKLGLAESGSAANGKGPQDMGLMLCIYYLPEVMVCIYYWPELMA